MPRKANPRESISALDRIGPAETAQLLPQLLKSHPELQSEAEALALRMITAVDPEGVADALAFAFSSISQEEIWDRSGSDSLGGYTAPDEAAGELCEEALAPFIEGLNHLLTMGLLEPALAQVKGMILGLHGLKGRLPDDAEEYPSDSGIYEVLEAWVQGQSVRADASLLAWVGEVLPDWRAKVEPALEHLRKSTAKSR
jgi:hypothetical protein